jgi:hypothetical protein
MYVICMMYVWEKWTSVMVSPSNQAEVKMSVLRRAQDDILNQNPIALKLKSDSLFAK